MRSPPSCRGSTGTAIPIVRRPSCARRSPSSTACRRTRCSPPTGRTRCCRPCCWRTPGPGRTVATFEPTYQMHAQIARVTGATVVEGRRAADFTLDPGRGRAGPRANTTRRGVPHVAEQPDRPGRAGRTGAAAAGAELPAWSSSTRRTPSSPTGPRSTWSSEDRPLVVTRTFSKTWSMAGARLGYLIGPTWLVAELEKVVLPYHLDTVKQIAGRIALRFVDDMDDRVRLIVSERERRQRRHSPTSASRCSRAAPTSCCSAASIAAGSRRVAGPRRPRRAGPRLFELAAPRQLPAGHDRHTRREHRVPRRARRARRPAIDAGSSSATDWRSRDPHR